MTPRGPIVVSPVHYLRGLFLAVGCPFEPSDTLTQTGVEVSGEGGRRLRVIGVGSCNRLDVFEWVGTRSPGTGGRYGTKTDIDAVNCYPRKIKVMSL